MRDPDLDAVLIGGREQREIVIVDYSSDWPRRFEEERERIATALGAVARRIEHVGSTAVPGLAAKPIIDVLVAVEDPEAEEAYVPALERPATSCGCVNPGTGCFERQCATSTFTSGGRGLRTSGGTSCSATASGAVRRTGSSTSGRSASWSGDGAT